MKLIQKSVAAFEKKFNNKTFLYRAYSMLYRNILKKEIKLAEINKEDRILNIGCGGMPFSAVYLAKLTDARVAAIDCDKKACQQANRCIKNFDLEDKIKIINGDGRDFNPENYSVVLVALQAEPKKLIMENLYANSLPGTRFIFRKAREIFNNQYDRPPENYPVTSKIKQSMITFNNSLLYVKA